MPVILALGGGSRKNVKAILNSMSAWATGDPCLKTKEKEEEESRMFLGGLFSPYQCKLWSHTKILQQKSATWFSASSPLVGPLFSVKMNLCVSSRIIEGGK